MGNCLKTTETGAYEVTWFIVLSYAVVKTFFLSIVTQ